MTGRNSRQKAEFLASSSVSPEDVEILGKKRKADEAFLDVFKNQVDVFKQQNTILNQQNKILAAKFNL